MKLRRFWGGNLQESTSGIYVLYDEVEHLERMYDTLSAKLDAAVDEAARLRKEAREAFELGRETKKREIERAETEVYYDQEHKAWGQEQRRLRVERNGRRMVNLKGLLRQLLESLEKLDLP